MGAPVSESELHPAALEPVADLFHTPTALSNMNGARIDLSYVPARPAESLDYRWGKYEAAHGTDSSTGRRIGGFCADLEERTQGEQTVLVCTHGEFEHLDDLLV